MSATAQTTEVVTATEPGAPTQPAQSAPKSGQQQQNNNNNNKDNNNNNNAANNKKRIIIRNLPPGTTRDELRELCNRYGRVINVEIVSKFQNRPFGFVSFLTEEDAGYSAYRLDGYRYKDCDLNASESNSKGNQNARGAKNAQQRGAPGPNNKDNLNDSKQSKKKKVMYSLRALTPHNPPTMNQAPPLPVNKTPAQNTIKEDEQQQAPNTKFTQGQNENQVHQSPVAGQNAEAGQPNTNNYPRNNRRRNNNNNNQDQGQKRNNNNRNPRNRGEFRPVQQKRQQSDNQSENNVNEDAKQDTTSSTPNPSPQVDSKPGQQGQNNAQNRQTNKPNQSGNRPGGQNRYNNNNNNNNNNNTRSRGRQTRGSGGQGGQGGQGSQGGQKNNNKNQGNDNSGKQDLIVASVQYSTDNQPVTNVKVNVSKKDISLNLKLNPEEFKQFLSVLQPFIEKNKSTTIDNQNVNDAKNGNNKKISSPL